jgi:hypothetical protein
VSQFGYQNVSVTILRSQCEDYYVRMWMWVSQCGYHYVSIKDNDLLW